MHETGLLQATLSELTDRAGDAPIRSVVLATGPGVDQQAARSAWAALCAGTAAAEVDVTWTESLDELACFDCGRHYHGHRLSLCPVCGASGLVVDPAPELAIVEWRAT